MEVLIDGMRVFEYGIEQKPILGQLLGNAPCRVALTSSDSQKTIMIRFTNNYSKPGIYVSTMHLGSKEALIVSTLRQNLGLIVCLGVLRSRGRHPVPEQCNFPPEGTKSLLYAVSLSGAFHCLLRGLAPDRFLTSELFTHNVVFVCILSFYSFMLNPVFMLLFISELCHSRERGGKILCCLMLLNIIIQSVLYVCGIADFPQMLFISHLF